MRGRILRRGVVTVLLTVMLTGCAGLPQDGAVQRVEVGDAAAGSTARYEPVPPAPGASPQQVVRGYLDAMLAYPVSRAVASEYLTPEAAARWRTSDRTEIYSAPSLAADPEAPDQVGLERFVEADLDGQGRRTTRGRTVRTDLQLERVEGQWRIANPPQGLLVTERFAEDYLRPFTIHFFDQQARTLVPELVHLVVGETLPTALVSSLARGPGEGSTLRTFVPDVADLRPSVPIGPDGVAEVEFTSGMEEQSPVDQQRASAQLVWTLRQIEGVGAVRFLGATALRMPGGDTVQPVDAWGRYEPDSPTGSPWVLAEDTLREVVDLALGPAERDASRASAVAVLDDAVAGVEDDGTTVVVSGLDGEERGSVPAQDVRDLSWGPPGELVLLDAPDGRARLRTWRAGEAVEVDTSAVDDLGALRLSPEGARYVALVDGALAVGAVVRGDGQRALELTEPDVLDLDLTALGSPTWSSPTRVSFLAETELGRQVHSVGVDGSDLRGGLRGGAALLPDVDSRILVSRIEDGRAWVLDARERVWTRAEGGAWTQLDGDPVSFLAPPG